MSKGLHIILSSIALVASSLIDRLVLWIVQQKLDKIKREDYFESWIHILRGMLHG